MPGIRWRILSGAVAMIATLVALGWYFLWVPPVSAPVLTGRVITGAVDVDGLRRTYRVYRPATLSLTAALVLVLHGSNQDGGRIRASTGYAFDRLADRAGFILIYPDGYEGNWNGCNATGNYSANRLDIDDVRALQAVVAQVAAVHGGDRHRVFAVGISRGGHMAYRLALQAPESFRAVAAIGANFPTADNSKCADTATATASVLVMNGTADPLNPFDGGQVSLFGMYRRGTVRSTRATAEMFARRNGLDDPPEPLLVAAHEAPVEALLWQNDGLVEVESISVRGGGHWLPQSYRRAPRLLGPSPGGVDGPAIIWGFFADLRDRQRVEHADDVAPLPRTR